MSHLKVQPTPFVWPFHHPREQCMRGKPPQFQFYCFSIHILQQSECKCSNIKLLVLQRAKSRFREKENSSASFHLARSLASWPFCTTASALRPSRLPPTANCGRSNDNAFRQSWWGQGWRDRQNTQNSSKGRLIRCSITLPQASMTVKERKSALIHPPHCKQTLAGALLLFILTLTASRL